LLQIQTIIGHSEIVILRIF